MIGIEWGLRGAVLWLVGALIAMTSSSLPALTDEQSGEQGHRPAHASDHVLVKLEPGFAPNEVLGGSSERVFDDWHRVPVPKGRTAVQAVAELFSRPGVTTAEVDPVVQIDDFGAPAPLGHLGAIVMNDPHFGLQWHLPAVQADMAWPESTGEGVVVAVIDTGISRGGDDLDCHTLASPYNAISGEKGATAAKDENGHGTHVAGTVAQCTNNGVGVAGVAFDARLMPVRVLNSSGTGLMSDVAEGIEWARSHGADVINLSLGCACSLTLVDDVIEAAVGDGVVVVAAAGNQGDDTILYPASHPEVIAVGATGYSNTRAPYSNGGEDLDLVAPGGNLNKDANHDGHPDGVLQETFCDRPSNLCPPSLTGPNGWGYYFMQGTSMATPHVSAAAALILAKNPGAEPEAVRRALTRTALDLGPTGFDSSYGHGLLQIHDALGFDVLEPVWDEFDQLVVETYGETQLTLAWDPATDNVGVTGYRLRMGGKTVTDTAGRQATVEGLQPGAAYQFDVLARDKAGNWSEALEATFQTARAFLDTPGSTFYNDILWMSGMDITKGCNPPANDLFCPDDPVTRGQMAAFLVRALQLDENAHQGFEDVPADSTFAQDIGKLATAGITRGCNPPTNDRFCPDDPVTRAQMAAFLVRALELTANTHAGFADVPEDSTFAVDIGKLATAGITLGCNPPANNLFCPDEPVTRGQLAAFLRRALG